MLSLPIRYPEELPVSQRRDELAAAIRDHQVVVVAGETGSGKTTQLPKICLELGRGQGRLIGHTQPRRIAARSVADRIAEELGTPLGSTVGYQVRFSDHTGPDTQIKLMTDGILLAEMQRDPLLRRYDTLDHRRGARAQPQHRLPAGLPQGPAAAAPRPQAGHHLGDHRPGPVLPALRRRSGHRGLRAHLSRSRCATAPTARRHPSRRTATTATRCRPCSTPSTSSGPRASGDILVFCSGEREIRDTADALRRKELPHTEVLPLYARLSSAEQHRVFASAHRPAGGAGHQRRRDLADRPRHPLRRRPRHRADLPLQPPAQGAAAADRADQPGQRAAAGRPLRPGRRRRLHPAVRRGGLRGAGPSSPTRRSCAPTWRRSSCR